jgi:Calcineurin-like phosphoesterase
MSKRIKTRLALGLVGLIVATVLVAYIGRASADTPLPVAQYSGFSSTLTRAPYVTDLTQTSAYINWATTSNKPGSVQVSPAPGSTCPASTTTWSPSAAPVGTKLPGAVNPTSSVAPPATLSTWQFSVVNGATSTSEYQASVDVSGLSPATQYCYAVFSTDATGAVDLLPPAQPDQFFTTLSPGTTTSTTAVTFDVIDDTGENYADTTSTSGLPFGNGYNPDEASLYSQIGTSKAQFLIDAGDTAYNSGTESNFGDLEQLETPGTVPEISNIFGPNYYPLAGGIPTFTAAGDHNQDPTTIKVWPTPNTAAASGGTFAYDSYAAAGIDGITTSAPDDWYAFSTGNVRVYVIDGGWGESATSGKLGSTTGSLCGAAGTSAAVACEPYQADADQHWQTTSPEYQWLAADLAAHPGGIKLAAFHFPLRSDSLSQPSDPYAQDSSANPNAPTSLEALLSSNGVGIAFNGHAHTYQRIAPSGPGQIVNYVTGGGGGVLGPVDTGTTCQSFQASGSIYALGWSPSSTDSTVGTGSYCGPAATAPAALTAADVYNFLKVTVSGDTVTVTPTNAAGATFDVQTYTFTPTVTPSTPNPVTATATGTTSVQLTWGPSTDTGSTVASYRISRNGQPLAAVPSTVTSYTDTSAQPATVYTYTVAAVDSNGVSSWPGTSNTVATFSPPPAQSSAAQTDCMSQLPPGSVVGAAALDDGSGYYEVDAQGDVAAFGGAVCYGAMTGTPLTRPVVGMALDRATGGYWLVASDGGVFSFNAPFEGSTGGMTLNKPVVGMGATPDGAGYWLVASDGGVFSFNATFYGGTGLMKLNKPIVGMAVDRTTGGYWLVASDGGVFNFNAPFDGATGGMKLNKPIVGIDAVADGSGYRLVASDGGVFTGFNVPFYGGTGLMALNKPMVTTMNDNSGDGYWLVASDGGVFSFHAPFYGSAAG